MDSVRVSDVMNAPVIGVSDEAPLSEAVRLMHEHGISGLVVVDHSGYMVGVLSQTDLVRSWQAGVDYGAVMNSPVGEYMSRDVISCAPHKSLSYAMQLLDKHQIHRLVVVNTHDGGRFVSDRMMPVGILTQTDVVRALTRSLSAEEGSDATE